MDYTLNLFHGYNNDNSNYSIDNNNNGCHLMNTVTLSKRGDGVNANSAQLMTNNNNIRASANRSRASHKDIGYMHLRDDAKFTFIADQEENRINRREARWATKDSSGGGQGNGGKFTGTGTGSGSGFRSNSPKGHLGNTPGKPAARSSGGGGDRFQLTQYVIDAISGRGRHPDFDAQVLASCMNIRKWPDWHPINVKDITCPPICEMRQNNEREIPDWLKPNCCPLQSSLGLLCGQSQPPLRHNVPQRSILKQPPLRQVRTRSSSSSSCSESDASSTSTKTSSKSSDGSTSSSSCCDFGEEDECACKTCKIGQIRDKITAERRECGKGSRSGGKKIRSEKRSTPDSCGDTGTDVSESYSSNSSNLESSASHSGSSESDRFHGRKGRKQEEYDCETIGGSEIDILSLNCPGMEGIMGGGGGSGGVGGGKTGNGMPCGKGQGGGGKEGGNGHKEALLDMNCADISHPTGTSPCRDGGNTGNGQRGSGGRGPGSGGNEETRCMSPSQLKGFTEELVESIMCKVKHRMELPEGQEDEYSKECEKKVIAFVTQLNSSGVNICPPDSKNNSNDPNYKLSEMDEKRGSGSNEGKNSGAGGTGGGGSACTSRPSNEPAGHAAGGAAATHSSGAASTSNSVAHQISGGSGGTGGCPNIANARNQHGRAESPCFGVYLSPNCRQTPMPKSTAVGCPNLKNGASAMGGQDGGALMCFKTACVAMPESADDQRMFLTDLLQKLFTGVRSKLQSMLMTASGDSGGPEVADANAAPNIDHIMDGVDKEVEMTLLPRTVERIIALHEEGVPLDSIDCDFSMVAYSGLFVDTIVTNTVLVKRHDQQRRRRYVKSFVNTDIKD